MYFQRVYDQGLAQASYFIGCQQLGVALVIDPKRDVDTYLEIARQNSMQITHVAETHIHADFLSGARELTALTGAKLYLSDEGGPDWQYEFDHVGLKDGDEFRVGNLKIEVMHTPGHTPESISFLLTDLPASEEPVMIFTGDFVFVGDIGRPDLLEKAAGMVGTQEVGARQMYQSLKRFAQLPDHVQVWPGHGAGSACGKALGAVPSSTVGYEKIRNWAFQYENDEDGFVRYLLEGQPEPPKYFAMMKKLNKLDRPLLTEVPKPEKLSIPQLKDALKKGITVVDTRSKTEFADGFIPGTINIQGNNSFSTWMGWFVSYEKPFILIAEESQLDDLTRKLMRIGLDNIMGYVDGVQDWVAEGGKLSKSKTISIDEFKKILSTNHTQIIDLRGATEYTAGHIKGTENLFIGTLTDNLDKIRKDQQVILLCLSGDRTTIGHSLLVRHGFQNVKSFSGGVREWVTEGNDLINLS
ncbi:MAG TPA: MBL fold metallo-hydrolase [Cyclobacteriaceae bacterium]|jgi:hydroxyacylglutathione hydrolase|nr:MBL fold metallo-hydrolase [Cyclobacteriaceae bacterium]PZN52529.1 MAG: MBL fold metallo-hydrolase [Bacteroidota bacterium]